MSYTKGPWYFITTEGTDFTAISTKKDIDDTIDLNYEVFGSSEWLRVTHDDLILMSAAPELLEALEWLRDKTDNAILGNPIGDYDEVRLFVDNAIAKAKGVNHD